jgi:hypothetical protein
MPHAKAFKILHFQVNVPSFLIHVHLIRKRKLIFYENGIEILLLLLLLLLIEYKINLHRC